MLNNQPPPIWREVSQLLPQTEQDYLKNNLKRRVFTQLTIHKESQLCS